MDTFSNDMKQWNSKKKELWNNRKRKPASSVGASKGISPNTCKNNTFTNKVQSGIGRMACLSPVLL